MAYVLFITTLVKLTFHLFEKLYSLSMTLGLKKFFEFEYGLFSEREGKRRGREGGMRRRGLSHLFHRAHILKQRKNF